MSSKDAGIAILIAQKPPRPQNICSSDLDTAEPGKRAKDQDLEHFTDHPPRAWLRSFVGPEGPMIDITRRLHPDRLGMFTCAYPERPVATREGLLLTLAVLDRLGHENGGSVRDPLPGHRNYS